MHKKFLFTVIVIIVLNIFIGCSNSFGKKTIEKPDYIQNFLTINNVKKISIQAQYKTNSGLETKNYEVITSKSEIKNIINKINEQRFLRLDLLDSTNKNAFDSNKIIIKDKNKLYGICIGLEFIKPVFGSISLNLISSTSSVGVDIAAQDIGKGHDTIYICSNREFITKIFNVAASSK